MLNQIQKLKSEIARLRQLASKDPLTGLYNRRGFLEEGGKVFRVVLEAKKYQGRRQNYLVNNLSLVFLDLDDFKKINDAFGHLAGDAVLKSVARLLEGALRSNDLICRWGGEEMVIMLVGAESQDALRTAESLRKKISSRVFKFRSKRIRLTGSFGVVEIKEKGKIPPPLKLRRAGKNEKGIKVERKLEELIAKADKAMYGAKKEGKNRVGTI